MSKLVWTCRKCRYAVDGMGTPCNECGTPQRIPILFANGQRRYLPDGMSIDDFDVLINGTSPTSVGAQLNTANKSESMES